MRIKKQWKRLIAACMAAVLLNSTLCSDLVATAAGVESTEEAVQELQSAASANTQENDVDAGQDSVKTVNQTPEEQSAPAAEQNVYADGEIWIYNADQLSAIGTGSQVYSGDESADTFGTGDAVTDENGNPVVYSLDAAYVLANDIPLDSSNIWQLPDGFAGSFASADGGTSSTLYDSESDTIYLYHPYQLALMDGSEDTETEPVMSADYDAAQFGVGQMVYPNGEDQANLTYSRSHNYVLSRYFNPAMPEMVAAQVQDEVTTQIGGRDYVGQVIYNEKDSEGKTTQYILIGNKQQLDAIGKTDSKGNPIKVTEPVWEQKYKWGGLLSGYVKAGPATPYYPGDADITTDQLLYDDPEAEYHEIGNTTMLGSSEYRGSQKTESDTGVEIAYSDDAKKNVNMERLSGDDSDPAYTTWANYIIFREIDLNNEERNPIMFSGKMEGRLNMESGKNVTIKNINVVPATKTESREDKLDTSKNVGIGFFGTITNQPDANNFGISGGTASVKNITLSGGKVSNTMAEAASGTTLVSGVLDLVGGLLGAVGGLLDTILGGLGGILANLTGSTNIFKDININLKKLLTDLFDIRKEAEDTYATGGFAGRIVGDVEVSGCKVENITVTNVRGMTGGFVGYTEGLTEYDGLSETLKATTGLLEGLLNVIPGLGLGDLITFLLKNNSLITLDQLIPTQYIPASISGCEVSGISTIGSEDQKYAGGFVGVQIGSKLSDCKVSGLKSVVASKYAGGFAGVTRDAVIRGILNDLNLNLTLLNPKSFTSNCTVMGDSLTVESKGKYAGGFTGMTANSDITNSGVSELSKVTASGDYAGGFTGRATLGADIIMAGADEKDITQAGLLSTLGDLLGSVLGSDGGADLLNLLGVSSSSFDGCSVAGTDINITAVDYAGGFVGRGEGMTMAGTTESTVTGLKTVTAGNYAGGAAGRLVPANAAGIIDGTVSVANALEFSLKNLKIQGSYTVTASENYAGGAVGQAIGGDIDRVTVSDIQKVSAANYAGGFVGYAGTGDLAGVGGLDVLGLVKISNLLQVAQMMELQVNNSSVTGNDLTVEATGNTAGKNYFAGGFVGENASGKFTASHVEGLKLVNTAHKGISVTDKKITEAGYAGGFAARSQVGGLASVGDQNTVEGLLGTGDTLNITKLTTAVGYLIPKYTNCYVEFTNSDGTSAQVTGALAGGFIAEMQGGTVDNTTLENDYAVRNAKYIEGAYYAGGFAGQILAGGLAQSGGLSLLGTEIKLADLLSVLEVYIPSVKSAGVSSEKTDAATDDTIGLKVIASQSEGTDVNSGSAGGYVGVARGARISNSDVQKLATKSSKKGIGKDDYAVKAPSYAGGYAGKIDIGSAAAVGDQLKVLNLVQVGNLTNALDAVESKFLSSDVYGKPGGFNVYASDGNAGGYVGSLEGSLLNDCDSYNFEYIEGVVSAGGYAGTMQPGNVANLVDDTKILNGLVSATDLLSLAKTFISRTWNSETTAVPCGGYVKATGESDNGTLKGLAGGYVGYNLGGQITGNKTAEDAAESVKLKTASAIRIRSVIGQEYAGGFTGLMKAANIADTGSLKLLWGVVQADKIIQAAQAVYPTETNTQVTGPLRDMDLATWNAWVEAVGKYGAYGDKFVNKTFQTQEALNTFLKDYIYGYTVEALAEDNGTGIDDGGSAGGYVGRMEGGVTTNAHALDVKSVEAYRSAGGFAGEMITGTVANAGKITIGDLKLADNIGLVDTFVPVIYSSSVTGYQSGMTVEATADSDNTAIGNAGGFAGYISGGQIWVSKEEQNSGEAAAAAEGEETPKAAKVDNLKSVTSKKYAGGFAGVMEAGSALELDAQSENGLLNQILSHIITSKDIDALASVLNATLPTVSSASVDGSNIVIDAADGSHAKAVGGFVGMAKGAVIGKRDGSQRITVNNLKQVVGQKYAGGFAGITDVSGVAEVATENTTILGILGLENIDVLNAFRTYIYSAEVNGVDSGLFVEAEKTSSQGLAALFSTTNEAYKDGNAGGFVGSLLNSTVLDSNVTNLSAVKAPNYTGGFAGLTGKSGVVDADNVNVLEDLLDLSAGVVDVVGSTIEKSSVTGITAGYTISSSGGSEEIAGGFVGYGDLARIDECTANELKQVYSDEVAGGFIGKTSFAYLVDINAGSPALLNPVLNIVNELLKLLYIDDLQSLGVIQVQLPDPLNKTLELKVLSDGNALSVTLLGLKISVALSKGTGEEGTDVAQVHIGDSYIELKCNQEKGVTDDSNLKIGLIKANRTRVANATVIGIASGYDVFGGGAGNDKDGTGKNGYAGGFVGYNDEGLLENNTMLQADTIRGTKDKIGEFSGASCLESSYDFNTLKGIEGENNKYYVYRVWDEDALTKICDKNDQVISDMEVLTPAVTMDGIAYYMYPVEHMKNSEQYKHKDLWEGAYQTTANNLVEFPVNVYVSAAQADLMLGTKTEQNEMEPGKEEGGVQDPCDEEAELTIQKIWIDNNNSGNTRPETDGKDTIKITVTQDGETYVKDGVTNPFQMTEEQATADPNVWVTTMKVPVYKKTADGNLEKYQYDVSETPIDGYTTIYNKSEDGYTLYIINFLEDELVKSDSVVIDYGLSVDIDVLTNDRVDEYGMNGKLAGVSVRNDSETPTGALTPTAEGQYGTATMRPKDKTDTSSAIAEGNIRYTPKNMEMSSYEKLTYAVELQNTKNEQNYVYGELNVIPATEIYYEDDFSAIKYTDGEISNNPDESLTSDTNYKNHGKWETLTDTANSTNSDVQDTDRPGIVQAAEGLKDADNLYGNDSHYETDHTYSNGTIHKVRVSSLNNFTKGGKMPVASFNFTGTGFDVISITDSSGGTLRTIIKDEAGNTVDDVVVDTYYGYRYDTKSGKWVVEPDNSETLYQIPVLKIEDLKYGTYSVEIYPMYSEMFDVAHKTYFDLYLDSIRIYDPVNPDGTGDDYEFIKDIYNSDGENQPRFTELRDILLNAHNVAGVMNGTVFVDGNGNVNDIKEYEAYGPKNEVYLSPRQAISFYLWTDYIPDKVQLSAKLAYNSQTELGIATGVAPSQNGTSEWEFFKIKTWDIQTAYDCYYEFTDNCIWREATNDDGVGDDGQPFKKYITKYPIVIANVSEANQDSHNILSLTNLQWTGEGDVDEIETPETDDDTDLELPITLSAMNSNSAEEENKDIELLVTSNVDNIAAAYYFVNPPKYSVTVEYLSESGEKLSESYVKQGLCLGDSYDVTEVTKQIPDGYSILEVKGDAVQGSIDGNKVIQVILKEVLPEEKPGESGDSGSEDQGTGENVNNGSSDQGTNGNADNTVEHSQNNSGSQKNDSSEDDQGKAVRTGDEADALFWIILLAAAALTLTGIGYRRKLK